MDSGFVEVGSLPIVLPKGRGRGYVRVLAPRVKGKAPYPRTASRIRVEVCDASRSEILTFQANLGGAETELVLKWKSVLTAAEAWEMAFMIRNLIFGKSMKVPKRESSRTVPSEKRSRIKLRRSRDPRQQQRVLDLLLKGKKEQEIAEILDRTYNTVHHHVKALYKRYGVNSRAMLLAKVYKGPP